MTRANDGAGAGVCAVAALVASLDVSDCKCEFDDEVLIKRSCGEDTDGGDGVEDAVSDRGGTGSVESCGMDGPGGT